jgi:hypothetical protein
MRPGKAELGEGGSIGGQMIGDECRRAHAVFSHEFAHEPCCGLLIPLRLHQNVEHLAFGIDGTPEIHFTATDRDEHLVQVPCGIGLRSPGTKAPRVAQTERCDPSPNGLVRYIDPTLGQQFLDVTVAQREAEIDPDRVLNDLGWKAITDVGDG